MASPVCFLTMRMLLLFLLSLFHLRACYSSPSMQPLCHDDESHALLQLKESLVINESTSYEPSAYPKSGSQLEKLLLAGTNFSGQLPESIGNLKSLTELDVAESNFSGVMPSSLGNLTKLNYLDLSDNFFSGKIPSTFVNLLQLTYLSLSYNNFTSGTLHWLGNLTRLNYVDLAGTNSYGEIPSCLGNLTQLTMLKLGKNELTGPIPESIFWLPNLETLDLQKNFFSGTVKFGLLKSRSLVSFQLSGNNLSVVHYHNDSIALLKFKTLGLGGCNLSGEFPTFLQSQNHLEFLELGGNKIEGHIPKWFMNLDTETLVYLSLGGNLLTGFEQPVDVLRWNNLKILVLEQNKLQGALPIPPPSIISYLASDNQLTGEIAPAICNLTSLFILQLSHNNFNSKLPQCLGNISNTASVVILRNSSFIGYRIFYAFDYAMTMTNKGVVTKYEKIQEFLTAIDLSRNRFEGGIPDALGDLKELYLLNLSNNFLTGGIPPSLSNLKGLEALDLSQNKLSGEIPVQLAQLTFLAVFNVSHNLLSGPIPRGNQFETFDNTSFDVNPGLCGNPLSKKCGNGEDSLPAPKEDEGSGYPLEFGWKVVVIGYASGLVIGAILGCAMNTRKYEWVVKNYFVNKGQNLKTRLRRN
ncbi:hypothetical protein POTOM_051992 [Populus tomentosa]|uniref:Receptor-like protein 12 n=1 Tax=Populus tomentosa TaxID=118781 RepID=A0A8X7Y729_POPTO|nr:hypothetical protein POTOM_051992 [Populus tomentosa]